VRHLVGDVDASDQQVQNEEIFFSLSQASDDIYEAASLTARAIAARYGRLVDTSVDQTGIQASYSQRQKHYMDLAFELDRQAKKYGGATLGVPSAGGLSRSEVMAVDSDDDRVPSMFVIDALRETRHDEYPE
jgi:hypothetical protein